MRRYLRHRYALAVPFVLLALATLVGGAVNAMDARGRVVDDTSAEPIAGVSVTYGQRAAVSDSDGVYLIANVPRGARLAAQKAGYSRAVSVAADVGEIRLSPLSIVFTVKDETTGKGIPQPEARQREKLLGKGGETGELNVAPYPLRDAPVLICAASYESKEITPKGAAMDVLLRSGGAGCPPLPTPSPTATPSGSSAPSPTPTAAPSAGPTAAPSPSRSP